MAKNGWQGSAVPPQRAIYSYVLEKMRIHRTLMLVKKERLLDDIKIIEKREKQVAFLRSKMKALQKNVAENVQYIEKKMKALRNEKEAEKARLRQYVAMIESLQANGEQTRSVYTSKQQILEIEDKLMNAIEEALGKLFEERDTDKQALQNIIQKKRKLLTQSVRNHREAASLLPAEKKVVERMAAQQAQAAHIAGQRLRELHRSHQKVLKEEISLHKQERNFQKELKRLAARKRGIKKSLERLK